MTSLEKGLREFAQFAAKLKGDEKSEAQTFLFHLLAAFGHDSNTLPEGSTFEYRVRFPSPPMPENPGAAVSLAPSDGERAGVRGRSADRTKFADFVWPGRCLIEMKSRGVKLSKHYQQTFDYWLNLVPHRPPYVVLCNFDEFWIYDFNTQLYEPVDRMPVADLPGRHAALNFLFPRAFQPLFGHNWVEVTREAAKDVANAFNSLVFRGEDRVRARRFILQCVVAMFAEDIGLLPQDIFTRLLDECRRGASSYDLIGGLFRQMNDSNPARAGRYAGVDYFNGGLFANIDPIELTPPELGPLYAAANENNWGYVQPVIFGTLFESSLGKEERHALGAHFTYESDIQKIVRPTIVRPWDERIAGARTAPDLLALLKELRQFRVLDPACGSGNFLFVAYRALRELEQRLLLRLFAQDKRQFPKVGLASGISPRNFFGLDVNENAVETAKVTLMLARRLAHRQAEKFWEDHADELPGQDTHSLEFERDLPLDNLDANILCADALFTPWSEADAIIGNPPYLGSRYLAKEHGYEYARKVYAAFPDVPKMADFCVYWFRLAHDRLKPGGRAGLVGTKTIRQNESREASLDYIVANGGTITEAVSHQVWSGEAAVHVALVNWLKGEQAGAKKLYTQIGDAKDSPWKCDELALITSSLSSGTDVSAARRLKANQEPKMVFTGQNPCHEGFLISPEQAARMLADDPNHRDVLFPYMNGDDLVTTGRPCRWAIDFAQRDMTKAMHYKAAFDLVKKLVMQDVLAKAEAEKKATGKESTRWTRMAKRWWQFRDWMPGTVTAVNSGPRYIVCPRVTKRPIFEFVSREVRPDIQLIVFPFADDYSFGILQSGIHWAWFTAKCSTLTARFRYTSDTVFDTFPWPQFGDVAIPDGSVPPVAIPKGLNNPAQGCEARATLGNAAAKTANPERVASQAAGSTLRPPSAVPLRSTGIPNSALAKVRAVAGAAVSLRALRREIMAANGWSLRDLYRTLETPGTNRLRDAQAALDTAVRAAYGMKQDEDALGFLLALNLELSAKEARGESIAPPGLPPPVAQTRELTSRDCITAPDAGGAT